MCEHGCKNGFMEGQQQSKREYFAELRLLEFFVLGGGGGGCGENKKIFFILLQKCFTLERTRMIKVFLTNAVQ